MTAFGGLKESVAASVKNLHWLDGGPPQEPTSRLLFNSQTLACIKTRNPYELRELIRRTLDGQELSPDHCRVLQKLTDSRILVEPGPVSPIVDPNQAAGAGQTLTTYLIVTQTCNLACLYCFANGGTYGHPSQMGTAVAHRAIDQVIATVMRNRLKRGQIIFFGGEPLLRFDVISDAVEYASLRSQSAGVEIIFGLTTNFTVASSEVVAFLKAHKFNLLVSIDGVDSRQNRFRRRTSGGDSTMQTLRNIRAADEAGIRYGVRCTVTSANVDSLSRIADHFLGQPKLRELDFVPVTPFDSNGNIVDPTCYPDPTVYVSQLRDILETHAASVCKVAPFSVFLNLLRNGGRKDACGACRDNMFVVDSSGSVYPCTNTVSLGSFCLGNVPAGIASGDIVKSRMREESRAWVRENCQGCPYRRLCQGHCLLNPLMDRLGFPIPDSARRYWRGIICAQTKACVDSVLWRAAMRTN